MARKAKAPVAKEKDAPVPEPEITSAPEATQDDTAKTTADGDDPQPDQGNDDTKSDTKEVGDDQTREQADELIKRVKVGRGSTRRITKALTDFDSAIAAFTKEMDLQFYTADEDGNRVGEWQFVSDLRKIRMGVNETVNAQLYPAALDEADEE